MNQTSTTQQGLIKHGGLHSTNRRTYVHNSTHMCIIVTKLQTIMCDIAGPPGSNPLANAVVCSHLILEYTVRLAIINAVELGRNGSLLLLFFFNFY